MYDLELIQYSKTIHVNGCGELYFLRPSNDVFHLKLLLMIGQNFVLIQILLQVYDINMKLIPRGAY